MGIFLVSAIIVIGMATMANCINIASAQFNPNLPFIPSTGQSPSSLSPPSSPSSPSSPSDNNQPVKANPSHTGNNTGNNTAPIVNSSTIGPPPRPVIVGPSNLTASPIIDENKVNVNAT